MSELEQEALSSIKCLNARTYTRFINTVNKSSVDVQYGERIGCMGELS